MHATASFPSMSNDQMTPTLPAEPTDWKRKQMEKLFFLSCYSFESIRMIYESTRSRTKTTKSITAHAIPLVLRLMTILVARILLGVTPGIL